MSANKKNGGSIAPHTHEFQFPMKEEKTTFQHFFYNKHKGTYFGRTPKSWGQLFLFYLIFYIVLAGMFTICLQGLFATLREDRPTWIMEESLIGVNPGLGFRPLSEITERGSVIQFDTKQPEQGRYWIDLLNKFFQQYNTTGYRNKHCSFGQPHADQDVCVVDTTKFGPCSAKEGYGYNNGRPCVFLKLNKIYGWQPQFYDNVAELPSDMPPQLVAHINATLPSERKQIWVSCTGQHASDQENVGEIKYYPLQGFPAFYYPYLNQRGYHSPLIAVQFEKLTISELFNIECRAWAKNIQYNGSMRDRQGSVVFQLFVD